MTGGIEENRGSDHGAVSQVEGVELVIVSEAVRKRESVEVGLITEVLSLLSDGRVHKKILGPPLEGHEGEGKLIVQGFLNEVDLSEYEIDWDEGTFEHNPIE